MNSLNRTQIISAIKAFGAKRTLIIRGEKGIGKTAIHAELQADPMFQNYIFPAVLDCTQMAEGSVWMPEVDSEAGVSRELPNEALGLSKANQRGVNGSKPVFIMFDEVGKAPRYIHNMLAPIVNDRRLGSYYFPEGSIIVCCTNLEQEGLGDTMAAHFEDRMVHLTMRKPSIDEWLNDFAVPHKVHEIVQATCHNFPKVFDSFMDYEVGGKYAGKACEKDNEYITNPRIAQKKSATPRSIHAASDIIYGKDMMDEETLGEALAGAVGESFSKCIMTTLRFGQQMPDYDRVINDPVNCPLPKDAVPQCVQVFQFVTRAEKAHVEPIVTYVQRMKDEMKGLFATIVSKNGQKAAMFAVNKEFGGLLASQRNFF